MRPAVTVLQLDTQFPRIPGDVACADTYLDAIEVIRIGGASVQNIVTSAPATIDIEPFEQAVERAKGDIVVTSCGFLSYWQDHLQTRIDRPFLSSALTALPRLESAFEPEALMILTFDADALNVAHLGRHIGYQNSLFGLGPQLHLRRVISNDETHLDENQASKELMELVAQERMPMHRHILLECTNLPPYKSAMRDRFGLGVSDILTEMERVRPGTVAPMFL